MTRWAIAADLNRCVGCQTCTAACKQANATAPGVQWRKVLDFESGEFPDVSRAFVPVGCMHCDNPPCLDVCPSQATRKRDDGLVTIDYDVCIGCSYCTVSCPYQARFRVDSPNEAYGHHKSMLHEVVRENWDRRSVAQKCTFCIDRIDEGLARGLTPGVDPAATPACVNACIAGALYFGDTDDPDSNISQVLAENHHNRMHEDLQTGPGFHYVWARGSENGQPEGGAEMLAEPVGLSAVSPRLQTQWDWRAAANFIFGGTGTGLFAAAALAGLFAPTLWLVMLAALALIGAGLFSVWLEIGRPWRFLNVFRNPGSSWMTREGMVAMPLFGFGLLAILLHSTSLSLLAACLGLAFLYCQGRILLAAKGIPAWRQSGIVALIMATGLTEGVGLYAAFIALTGEHGQLFYGTTAALAALVGLRFYVWRAYRQALGRTGAPTETLRALDGGRAGLHAPMQLLITAFLIAALALPPLIGVAGLLALATGWGFKITLITKAAFNQGYAIDRMPARGSGSSTRGIKPGWTTT